MSYCQECGSKEIKEWTGEYSSSNGKKEYRYICPVAPCVHGYCIPGKRIFKWYFLGYVAYCIRCGKACHED
jgi:hypothetical protein